MMQDTHHFLFGFANGQAANGVAVKTDFCQACEGLVAQVFVHASLDDAEQGIRVFQFAESIFRALRPTQRHPH